MEDDSFIGERRGGEDRPRNWACATARGGTERKEGMACELRLLRCGLRGGETTNRWRDPEAAIREAAAAAAELGQQSHSARVQIQ